jgi:hypothetical protein
MMTLLFHYLRRSWKLGLLVCIGAGGFMALVCRVFQQIHQSNGASAMQQAMPKWLQSAFNISPASFYELNGFVSVALQHPFLLAVLLSLPVTLITGFITGDTENGSIGLVLARPAGRLHVIISILLVVCFWMLLDTGAAVGGIWIGGRWTHFLPQMDFHVIGRAAVNLLLLEFAFAGLATLISSFSSIRGDATGWCVTLILVMYVWNFLANVWNVAGRLMNYSLFSYYQPTQTLLHQQLPVLHLEVLGITGVAGCVLALLVFRMRDFAV